MKTKIIIGIGLLAVAIIGIAAVGAPRKHDVVVLQAYQSWDYTQNGTNGYVGSSGFRIQATDGSKGSAFVPVTWWYTNGVYGQSGNLPFADVIATYLDHGYKIVVGGVSSTMNIDPVTVVLVRE